MTSHFIREKTNIFKIVIASILILPTLGFPMWGAYEYFFVPHYWKNRLTLYRLLKRGKVKVQEDRYSEFFGDKIVRFNLEIEGIKYYGAIWNSAELVLDRDIGSNDNYIGLFIGSLITKYINRKSIKMIEDLLDAKKKQSYN